MLNKEVLNILPIGIFVLLKSLVFSYYAREAENFCFLVYNVVLFIEYPLRCFFRCNAQHFTMRLIQRVPRIAAHIESFCVQIIFKTCYITLFLIKSHTKYVIVWVLFAVYNACMQCFFDFPVINMYRQRVHGFEILVYRFCGHYTYSFTCHIRRSIYRCPGGNIAPSIDHMLRHFIPIFFIESSIPSRNAEFSTNIASSLVAKRNGKSISDVSPSVNLFMTPVAATIISNAPLRVVSKASHCCQKRKVYEYPVSIVRRNCVLL